MTPSVGSPSEGAHVIGTLQRVVEVGEDEADRTCPDQRGNRCQECGCERARARRLIRCDRRLDDRQQVRCVRHRERQEAGECRSKRGGLVLEGLELQFLIRRPGRHARQPRDLRSRRINLFAERREVGFNVTKQICLSTLKSRRRVDELLAERIGDGGGARRTSVAGHDRQEGAIRGCVDLDSPGERLG